MESQLIVLLEEKESVVIARLEGNLDITTLSVFEEKIISLAESRFKHIILDFEHTSYVDSSGLGSIVKLYQILKKSGRRLSVLIVPEPDSMIIDLFQITKLDRYIKLYNNLEDATSEQS
jgi:anti-anti-sigma factor